MAKNRIEELKKIIIENNRKYYVENSPSISDYEYDMLMNELLSLEKAHPELASDDSPTKKVGSDLNLDKRTNEFKQVKHKYPMLSLSNSYDLGDVESFADRTYRLILDKFTYSCELKFDGTAICLSYKEGKLVQALTRGDGSIGDDVLENVKNIKNIPGQLKGNYPSEFEIRGEIFMPYSSFNRLNEERLKNEENPFANPRNAASGSIKLLNPKVVANRGLECTLYHILGENLGFNTQEEALQAASSWGLPISKERKICNNITEIEEYINYWDIERKNLEYATDGIVIKVNELNLHDSLGYTSKFPRWAIAYKFQAEQALTKLESIDYQVGRTGAITPVANLEPVLLSGTVVKRASLHNQEQMEILDIHIGDYVYVEKGGEIIPKITSVELSRRNGSIIKPKFPIFCPDCGSELIKDEAQAKAFCPNIKGCKTQIKNKLEHFISRKAMNIFGGEATIDQLFELGLVKSISDIYSLTKEGLLRLDKWKERSADNFLRSIEESKKTPFEKLLYALGIRYVGEATAKALAKHFKDIEVLAAATKAELLEVEDVGEVIADSLLLYFSDTDYLEEIVNLREKGLNFTLVEDEDSEKSNVLEGKSILITGVFSISRDAMKDLISSHSGKNTSSLSAKTDYLIVGEKSGSEKLKKAEKLGVKMISESEFLDLIGGKEEVKSTKLTLF